VENTKPNESTSTQSTFVSFDKESINIQNLPVEINSTKTEKKTVNINLTFIKQTLKSRLTVCQLALLILNILGILTIVIVTVILRKQPCSGMNLESKYINLSLSNLFILFRYFNNSRRPFLWRTSRW